MRLLVQLEAPFAPACAQVACQAGVNNGDPPPVSRGPTRTPTVNRLICYM